MTTQLSNNEADVLSSDNNTTQLPAEHHPMFSSLPPQLLIYIFTFAASTSVKCARALTLVSSWTCALATPYTHPACILGPDDVRKLALMLQSNFESADFESLTEGLKQLRHPEKIRHVWSVNTYYRGPVLTWLLTLTNMVNLSLEASVFLKFVAALAFKDDKTIGDLRLLIHRFHYTWTPIDLMFCESSLPAIHRILARVTHLRLHGKHKFSGRLSDIWAMFPRLACFAVPFQCHWDARSPFQYYEDAVGEIAPGLEMFVLVFSVYHGTKIYSREFMRWMTEIRTRDGRVWLALEDFDYMEEWKEDVEEGGGRFWRKAVRDTRVWEAVIRSMF